MNYKHQIDKGFLQNINLYYAVLIWFLFWLLNDAITLRMIVLSYKLNERNFYSQVQAFNSSYDINSQDYYSIIRFCDKFIPPGEKLQLILPAEDSVRYDFLSAKARYYLYPRNYGNNTEIANYILVYGVESFRIPENYRKIWAFSENKFLLAKSVVVNSSGI